MEVEPARALLPERFWNRALKSISWRIDVPTQTSAGPAVPGNSPALAIVQMTFSKIDDCGKEVDEPVTFSADLATLSAILASFERISALTGSGSAPAAAPPAPESPSS